MLFDPNQYAAQERYKLLSNLVLPRPIAWVSTLHANGLVNLAPFSFFNLVSNDPLALMISICRDESNRIKHTAMNIERSGEFVVNLVTEPLMAAMNLSAANFPEDTSEVSAAGLSTAPAHHLKVPRIIESPVNIECRLQHTLPLGSYTMYVGRIVAAHIADELVDARLRVHGFAPVGRMGSPASYCRTDTPFEVTRISYAQWQSAHKP